MVASLGSREEDEKEEVNKACYMVSTKWALTVIIMIIVIISLHRHHLHHHYQLEYFCLLPFSLMPVRGPIKFPAMPVSLRLTISFNR